MIRIVQVGDSHYDENSRFEECIAIHDWIAAEVERQRAHLVIHTGDVFERKSTPKERAAFAAWVQRIADHCPLVIVRGNHDVPLDLSLFARLETRYPVIVEERADVHVVDVGSDVYDVTFQVAVGCLAWPRKAELLAATGTIGQAAEQAAQDALHGVLRGLGAELSGHIGPRILAAHALVTGSRTSSGQPLIGHSMSLDLSELALAKADFYAIGHVHLPQQWSIDGAPVVYSGSPRRTDFGESEAKAIVVAEFEPTTTGAWQCARWDYVETPARAMLFGEDEWGENADGAFGWLVGWHGLDPDHADGAEVRLRYTVDSDRREAAKAAAAKVRDDLIARGAVMVKVEEEVRPAQRAKAPEVARPLTLAGKLSAFWSARGTVPDAARQARLGSKLSQLEEENRNAA
jgi:DNA repair exonuclease SbcCD nuclease subunit